MKKKVVYKKVQAFGKKIDSNYFLFLLEKEPLLTSSTPTRVNNGTTNTRPSLQSTASTLIQSTQKTKRLNNFTTETSTEETSKPLRATVTALVSSESVTSSASPGIKKSAQRVEKRSTVLVVSIVLPFCLSMVGVVAAVFFVRSKR